MKILSFSYCFPSGVRPTWGIFVLQRLAALSRLADVQVVAPAPTFPFLTRLRGPLPERHETMSGLEVFHPRFFYLPAIFQSLHPGFYARGLEKWLDHFCRQDRPDLLDAHFAWPDGAGVSRLARKLKMPFTITLRGKLYDCLRSRSQRRQLSDAFSRASAIFSVSKAMADLACELGAPPQRLHVTLNGVDRRMFRPMDKPEARQSLHLPQQRRYVVAVAHLMQTKGCRELVRALAMQDSDVNLIIVGGQAQRHCRQHLLDLAGQLGLRHRLLLPGRQSYSRVPLYLAAADVVAMASYREGCPNAVLEGLACGRPVVATAVGAVRDLIQPGVNGLIVPPRDSGPLGEAIADALTRQWPPAQLAASPAVRTWEDVAAQVYGVLAGILKKPHAPAPDASVAQAKGCTPYAAALESAPRNL